MYRVSFITLIFSLLTLLAVSCAPGPHASCPEGQVLAEGGNTCVENTCMNYSCGNNEHCIVSAQYGPNCECNNGYLEINTDNGMTCQKNPCSNNVCGGASCVPVKRNGRYIPQCGKPQHSCTGANTHVNAQGNCVCNDGYYMTNESGNDCIDPCLDFNCPDGQTCKVKYIYYDENNGEYAPMCEY